MNFKQYIILMAISSVLAWITFAFIIFSMSPEESGMGVFFMLYTTLLIALTSIFSILGLAIRAWIIKQDDIISKIAGQAFRQGALLSALVAGILYFQSKNILTWWLILLLILGLTMLEFFLISHKPVKEN